MGLDYLLILISLKSIDGTKEQDEKSRGLLSQNPHWH